MNTAFRIAFGCYELNLERKSLTYSLTETQTGTTWAEGFSVGWIELKERASGEISRHEFGACRLVSLSEKMSGAGKKILLGLDTPEGIPIDIYFTCAEKEIQLTVEASRDTKAFLVHRIGLLPGLCGDVESFVVPLGEGARICPKDLSMPQSLPLWQVGGLSMAFSGGIKNNSALALITDSAYALMQLSKESCDWTYERDPERRRLEVRVVLIPGGDPIAIARAYRDKLVAERGHVTLKKKARERPALARALAGEVVPRRVVAGEGGVNRWESIESTLMALADSAGGDALIGTDGFFDWSASAADFWEGVFPELPHWARAVPLYGVVWRDSVLAVGGEPGRRGTLCRAWQDRMPYVAGAFLRALRSVDGAEEAEFTDGVIVRVD